MLLVKLCAPSAWPSDRELFLQSSTSAQPAAPSKASMMSSELSFHNNAADRFCSFQEFLFAGQF